MRCLGKIIYVTGGARSGKSSFAEKKVFQLNKEKIYVATAISFDEEMKERVRNALDDIITNHPENEHIQ